MDTKWDSRMCRKAKERCKICSSGHHDEDTIFIKGSQDRKADDNSSRNEISTIQTKNYHDSKQIYIEDNHQLTIQLRNARERTRVQAVNNAFVRLRKVVPYTANRNKRVSKVKTIQSAIRYIKELELILFGGEIISRFQSNSNRQIRKDYFLSEEL